jgi:hypothetical protein
MIGVFKKTSGNYVVYMNNGADFNYEFEPVSLYVEHCDLNCFLVRDVLEIIAPISIHSSHWVSCSDVKTASSYFVDQGRMATIIYHKPVLASKIGYANWRYVRASDAYYAASRVAATERGVFDDADLPALNVDDDLPARFNSLVERGMVDGVRFVYDLCGRSPRHVLIDGFVLSAFVRRMTGASIFTQSSLDYFIKNANEIELTERQYATKKIDVVDIDDDVIEFKKGSFVLIGGEPFEIVSVSGVYPDRIVVCKRSSGAYALFGESDYAGHASGMCNINFLYNSLAKDIVANLLYKPGEEGFFRLYNGVGDVEVGFSKHGDDFVFVNEKRVKRLASTMQPAKSAAPNALKKQLLRLKANIGRQVLDEDLEYAREVAQAREVAKSVGLQASLKKLAMLLRH